MHKSAGSSLPKRSPRGNDDDEKLDPDRMMLERHDAETLVDACTVSVDFPEPIEAAICQPGQ